MLLYLHKGKSIGQRTVFRQIRLIIILLVIISSYWLLNRNLLFIYYVLIALAIMVLLIDYQRPKKTLANLQTKLPDLTIMIITNIFLAGIVLITGAAQSPLIGIIIIPIILFTTEFGTIIGVWNYIGLVVFLICNTIYGETTMNFKTLAFPVSLIVIAGTCLTTITTFHYFNYHFNQKINRLLTRDELTGLYNRRFLKFMVSKEIKAEKHFGFILIDINYFKYYNDCWGHSAGDNLLITIGKFFSKTVRPQDTVVRHSGDEFIVLLPESDQKTVEIIINKIIQSLESHHFPGEDCFPNHKLSISYGFTFFPSDARHYQDIFTAADQALYSYKKERLQSV